MAGNRGRYLWYDLMTTDTKAAQDFYTKLLGWGLETWTGAGFPYVMWMNKGQMLGGSMPLPDEAKNAGAPPHWIAYIGTPDVDATAKQVKDLGGQVHVPPQDIPEIGRFAVLAAPDGVVFAIYKGLEEPKEPKPPELGDCSWHEIAAGDEKKAWDFFSKLFGWEKRGEAHDMGPSGFYQEYGVPGVPFPVGGLFRKPAEMPAPPHLMLYFRVEDVPKAVEQVKALGGQILNGPMEVPGGDMIANCMDPQGAAFSLHHHKG